MTVVVAVIAQFLVGYNTGVMNAPADVVFPGHTTTEWSVAVSAFAIGGPFGAFLGDDKMIHSIQEVYYLIPSRI